MTTATATAIKPPVPRAFVASPQQRGFFDWVRNEQGSAVLIAVAGSGKSTTIVRSLAHIPENKSVAVLAFNSIIAKEMREKIVNYGIELGRPFRAVRAMTFHSMGFNAICYKMGVKSHQVRTDGSKLRNLIKETWQDEELETMYSTFVAKLVSLAKGQGLGVLTPNTEQEWQKLIVHHDLYLEAEDANEEIAISLAQRLLDDSNRVAKEKLWIDFDDQLYLPLLWRLRLYPQDWVFIDEAQDTNPVRRALAKLALKPGGRLVAVGDPRQAIYGFTGASHDAIDLIKRQFNAVELPLTVSYRCPKLVGNIAKRYVPFFETHEDAPLGEVHENMRLEDAIKILSPHDAILCRNTKPLVALAYQLMAKKIACHVLGSEIGKGLVGLIRKMRARDIDGLLEKLDAFRDREVAKFMAKGEEGRAEAVTDRVECVHVIIDALHENERTIAKLIESIEMLFKDGNSVLTLSTVHKSKGREWQNVAILEPSLMPSKFARQDWQAQQEENLIYVAVTRAQRRLIFLGGSTPDPMPRNDVSDSYSWDDRVVDE